MVNGSVNAEIYMKGVQLEDKSSFKCLTATISKEGCFNQDILIRITTAIATMYRADRSWHSHKIRFTTKPS